MERQICDIYTDVEGNGKRYNQLRDYCAAKKYQIARFARSPGRVNIISEHTDYNGYQVSPIALENDFVFAICLCDGPKCVKIEHVNAAYKPDQFDYALPPVEVAKPNAAWTMYVRAGFHAAAAYCAEFGIDFQEQFEEKSLVLVGTGNVPLDSGLSSSSALACCSALAFLFQQHEINMTRLAALVAKGEGLVALEGGGMDQAISLNAQKDKIAVINFIPRLHIQQLDFVAGVQIACLDSLKDSKKANCAANFYNQRVAECRACCALLIQQLKRQAQEDVEGTAACAKQFSYYEDYALHRTAAQIEMAFDVQTMYGCQSPSNMLAKLDGIPTAATLGELIKLLNYPSLDAILHDLFRTKIAENCLFGHYSDITEQHQLILRPRIEHVYSEAFRAQQFEKILKSDCEQEYKLAAITELINDSHTSCDKKYECSCAELNEVVAVSKSAGAFAARMTGAGLGGFAVALVHECDSAEFMAQMKAHYAKKGRNDIENCCFLTKCGSGGCFVLPE